MSKRAVIKNALLVAGIAAAVMIAYARGKHASSTPTASSNSASPPVATVASDSSLPSCCVVPDRFKTTPPAGMVWIPGGEFLMGTADTESFADEHPAHRVRV